MLNIRLTSLEESFRDLSFSVSCLSGKGTITSDELKTSTQDFDMPEARKAALAVIDYSLITNRLRSG